MSLGRADEWTEDIRITDTKLPLVTRLLREMEHCSYIIHRKTLPYGENSIEYRLWISLNLRVHQAILNHHQVLHRS